MDSPTQPLFPSGEAAGHRRATLRAVASEGSRTRAAMIGRERELARAQEILDDARVGRGGALVVNGEPGIGKTTLLEATARMADGFVRLWAHGVESQAIEGHSGLLELLTPVRERLVDVPAAQRDALASALGWGPAQEGADRFLLAAATMSLLAAAAERKPVLVLVDDVQWWDRDSLQALLFAVPRLGNDAVTVMFAQRSGSATPGLDFPALTLSGLPSDVAADLLPEGLAAGVAHRHAGAYGRKSPGAGRGVPRIDPSSADRRSAVAGHAAGRREAAGHVCRAAGDALGRGLVGGRRVRRGPSERERHDRRRDESGRRAPEAALDEAEERGVLIRDEHGLRFRHPLLRSAVLRRATPAERRAAHRSLAGALPVATAGSLRAWHLAEACVGADDDLAATLVEVASEHRTRRGFGAASLALERAVALTGDPELASDQLAGAAHDAFIAGDVERLNQLAARVLDGPANAQARAQILLTLGTLEQYAGSVQRAADLLLDAAGLSAGAQRVQALAELGNCRFRLTSPLATRRRESAPLSPGAER